MKKIYLILSLSLFFISGAQAKWFFFEPSVGYHQGHYNNMKASGIGIGLKLGINWNQMFIGPDIGYSPSLTLASVPPATGTSYDAKMMNQGVIVGWKISNWRLWFSYLLASKLDWNQAGVETVIEGDGHKFGIGGIVFNKLSINLEINFLSYDTQDVGGTSTDVNQYMDLAFISFSWPY